jgi:hypothetical protein
MPPPIIKKTTRQNMSEQISVWTPPPLPKGTDLLPPVIAGFEKVNTIGRENVHAEDMIVPIMSIVTGTSQSLKKDKTKIGWIHVSGVEQFYEAPLRVIVCAHTRGRALFPNAKIPEHKDLRTCTSRNAIHGTEYGECASCGHKEWGPNRQPPACAESHNFTVLTTDGIAIMRFKKYGFKEAKKFLSAWNLSPYPLWQFPAIITLEEKNELKNGQPVAYYVPHIDWDRRISLPESLQARAQVVHAQVSSAHEAGRFGAAEEDEYGVLPEL